MSDFEKAVAAALNTIRHSDDCAIYGSVNPEGPCDCDRDARLAPHVAAAIEAFGRTELPSENIRALFGETSTWYVNGVQYATMEEAEAALVNQRRALREAAGLRALRGSGETPQPQEPASE